MLIQGGRGDQSTFYIYLVSGSLWHEERATPGRSMVALIVPQPFSLFTVGGAAIFSQAIWKLTRQHSRHLAITRIYMKRKHARGGLRND